MNILEKKTNKHETILIFLAVLIGIWGAITMVLGGIAIMRAPEIDDPTGNGALGTDKNFIGTYSTTTTVDDNELVITIKITSADKCEMISSANVDGQVISDTTYFTYTYKTSLELKYQYGEQYDSHNALLLDDGNYKYCLWITNEQQGNYQFALSSKNGYLIFNKV